MLLSEGMDYCMYGYMYYWERAPRRERGRKVSLEGVYNTDIRGGRSQVLAAGLEVRCLGRKKKKRKRMVHIVVTSAPATSKSFL